MDRLQRQLNAEGEIARRTVLNTYNDTAKDRWLHPTKGWRSISVKRSHAAQITAEIKRGLRPWSSVAMREQP
jgi:hypothetical protein